MRRLLRLLIPLTLLVAACGGGSDVADGVRIVEVRATSFAFGPPEIRAAINESIAIELTSEDVEHDFVIDELDARVVAEAGETVTGGFSAGAESATFQYYCSVLGHRGEGMEGVLIVE